MSPLRSVADGERYVKQHVCSICGTRGPWTPEWSWFGSLRDYDERPERLVLACSALCQFDAKAAGHRP